MTPPGADDFERRISRLEAWMDARLVTKDVFDVWAKNVIDRLERGEEASTWLLRFVVLSLVGVVVNAIFLAVSAVGR